VFFIENGTFCTIAYPYILGVSDVIHWTRKEKVRPSFCYKINLSKITNKIEKRVAKVEQNKAAFLLL
jgi:hypothetical protein